MGITVSIEVTGDKLYHPGTAVVRVNGEVHAYLRVGESYEVKVLEPAYQTRRTVLTSLDK